MPAPTGKLVVCADGQIRDAHPHKVLKGVYWVRGQGRNGGPKLFGHIREIQEVPYFVTAVDEEIANADDA